MDERPRDQPHESRPSRVVETTLAFWALSFVLLLLFAWSDLHREFYFDEAWRADIIRSAHPLAELNAMRGIAAPIPPLWLGILHVASAVVPGGFSSLRIQSLLLASLFPALAGQIVRTIGAGHRALVDRRHGAFILGAIAAVAASASLDSFGIVFYLNDYPFQAALVSAFVLAWFYVERGWMALVWMSPFLVLMAFGTIAGLFILPAYAIWLFRSSAHRKSLAGWLPLLGAGLVAGFLYLATYRGQSSAGLEAYWAGHILRPGDVPIVDTFRVLLRTCGSMAFPGPIVARLDEVSGLIFLCLAVVGFRDLNRSWPWIVRSALIAWAIAVVASLAVKWPVTAVRVNLPFLSLWIVAGFIGLQRVIAICVRGRPRLALAVLVVPVLALVVLNAAEEPDSSAQAFARGLDGDLSVIRDSRAPQVVVVAYHFMSKPYIRGGLMNDDSGGSRYRLIQEAVGDPLVYSGLAAAIDELNLIDEAEVWCVIPYEIGPDATEQACVLDRDEFEEFYNERLDRAQLIGLRKVSSGS
ncbi:MAG: hypothetical protein K8R99_12020 [Actinomycetia bacterium]|nr:hypothetical protein [Actinomycetes bacterium]